MKMIIAIIQDIDNETVIQNLINAGLRVTQVACTGSFFKKGSTSLLIGLEDEKVDEAIQIIREHTTLPTEPGVKRATIFVLNVTNFLQI